LSTSGLGTTPTTRLAATTSPVLVGTSVILSVEIVKSTLNESLHFLFLTIFTLLLKVDTGNPELDFDRSQAEGTTLIEGTNGSLSHFDGLIEYKGLLESAWPCRVLLGLYLKGNDGTMLGKHFLNLSLGDLEGDVFDKNVRFEALLHVLLNRGTGLVD